MKDYVVKEMKVAVGITYLANKNIDETLDTEEDDIGVIAEVEAVEEVSLIGGVKHYSYSEHELTESGKQAVEDAVNEFIEKNGYTLLDYEFDIDRWDFMF